ncbi:MAG: hypothetical protein ACLQC7_07085 [Thermoplasmata archaeon]
MDAGWVLWPVAVLMAVTIAALVRWSTDARTVVVASVVVFLFVMMVAMFVATAIYFSWPGTRSLVLGLWIAAALMAVSVFPLFALILREAHDHVARGADYTPRRLRSPTVLALTVTGLVLASEILMGRSFQLAAGTPGTGAIGAGLGATIASPWFLFPMSLEMACTAFWIRGRLPAALAATFATQAVLMFFGPPALTSVPWLVASGVLSSAAMVGLLAYLLYGAYRGATFGGSVRAYIVRFLLVSAVMGLGLALWVATSDLTLFALATVLQMAIFFTAAVVPETFATLGPDPPAGNPPGRASDVPSAP